MWKLIWIILFVTFLTVVSQIGGLVLIVSLMISRCLKRKYNVGLFAVFMILYMISTFFIVPFIAPIFGREKIKNTNEIQATSILTTLLNRNYVKPDLNHLLKESS